MNDFSLRQLEYLLETIRCGSAAAAAQTLRVAPGAVSVGLSQLEQSLGVQLLIRTPGKGVAATPAGEMVAQDARAIMDRTAGIREVASAVRGEVHGVLRLGFFTTLSPWLFPRIAAHFAATYPGVELHLHEGVSSDLQAELKAGTLDAALLYENHLTAGIDSRPVIPVRLQLALAEAHPLAQSGGDVQLSDLSGETAILLDVEPSISHVEELLRRAGVRPSVRWTSANVETIRSLVARNLGYSILMGRPYGDATYDGLPIVYKRIRDHIPANSVVVAFPRGTIPTAKMRALIGFCAHEFASEGELPSAVGASSGAGAEGMGRL